MNFQIFNSLEDYLKFLEEFLNEKIYFIFHVLYLFLYIECTSIDSSLVSNQKIANFTYT